MNRSLAVLLSSLLLAAAGQAPPVPPPSQAPTPSPAEAPPADSSSPWLYNTRGRTGSGVQLHEQGDIEQAGRAFGTALGLAPDDPLMQFNAGTAGIAAAAPYSVELLAAAAGAAPDALRPAAFYNLGNAQMAGEDFPAAIEAYRDSLRLAPDNIDAKHNLELAMRKLQEQQQQQQDQQQNQEQPQDQQQQNPPQEQEQPQDQNDSPLPDFDEQPDMTAEQAAAILEAVENLEREQRRKQAMEQLKRAKGDRDW